MKTKWYLMALASLWLCGCSSSSKQEAEVVEEGLPVINLSDNVEEVKQLNLSDAAERVEIVKLETRKEALIGRMPGPIEITDNAIWVQNGVNNVFRFSRDGKFLNAVGKRGQGPDSYNQMSDFFVDEQKGEVYIFSVMTGIQVYDLDGNHLRKEYSGRIDQWFSSTMYFGMIHFDNEWLLKQNTTVYNYYENPQDSLWSIAILDDDFNKVKRFKNPAHIGHEDGIIKHGLGKDDHEIVNYWWETSTIYDTYNNELTFKLPDTDTIYVYNKQERILMPQYAIYADEDRGDYGLTHEMYPERQAFNYFTLVNYFPTKDYIYLLGSKGMQILTYAYDKRSRSVRLYKRKGEIYEHHSSGIQRMYGHDAFEYHRYFIINNDINGGDFYARYRSDGKYWIYPLQPGTEDYDKYVADLRKAPDAPKKQELLNVIDNTDEEDNPILLIAILK